ncbi:hypothetical protein BDB00DRAFT_878560 [Zychaea mexicana]|uniref:uncharacterized protein n=1 Tax=Zychaea mexicana TaxID=64656 RepID=UPI0022FF10E4|nr:uncharacterized protein BDB00DRAFT_878560 [Zychaea mexicana]KAI9484658.1 hypothetical protein BDB00DRAFT_878560 [Zychaea mexicana]
MLSTTSNNNISSNGCVVIDDTSLVAPPPPPPPPAPLAYKRPFCGDERQLQQYTPPLPSACYCVDCCSPPSSTSSVQGDSTTACMMDGGEGGAGDGGWFLAPNNPLSSGPIMMDPAYTMANAKAGSSSPITCDCCCYPPPGIVAMPSEEFRPAFYNPFEVKHRRRTSRAQFKVLEKTFLENPKPNAHKRRSLAQKLGMTPRGVQVWFQNRRAKAKAQQRREQQQQQEMTPPRVDVSAAEVAALAATSSSSATTTACSSSAAAPPMQRQHSNASSSYTEQLTPITPIDVFSFLDQQQHSHEFQQLQQDTAGKWDLVPGLMYSREAAADELKEQPLVTLDRVTETDTTTAAAFAALFDPYFGDIRRTSYPLAQQQEQQQMTMIAASSGHQHQQQQTDFSEATRRLSEPIYNNADLSWMTAPNSTATAVAAAAASVTTAAYHDFA